MRSLHRARAIDAQRFHLGIDVQRGNQQAHWLRLGDGREGGPIETAGWLVDSLCGKGRGRSCQKLTGREGRPVSTGTGTGPRHPEQEGGEGQAPTGAGEHCRL